jgi:hypothetical protein
MNTDIRGKGHIGIGLIMRARIIIHYQHYFSWRHMTAHPNLRAHPSEQMLFEVPAGRMDPKGGARQEHWSSDSMYNAATMIIIRIRLPMHYYIPAIASLVDSSFSSQGL